MIFDVSNSLSSHFDNPKNNFLVIRKGPTEGITGSAGIAEKNSINLSKATTNFN